MNSADNNDTRIFSQGGRKRRELNPTNAIVLDKQLMDEAQPMIQKKTLIDLEISDPLKVPQFSGVIGDFKKKQESWLAKSKYISDPILQDQTEESFQMPVNTSFIQFFSKEENKLRNQHQRDQARSSKQQQSEQPNGLDFYNSIAVSDENTGINNSEDPFMQGKQLKTPDQARWSVNLAKNFDFNKFNTPQEYPRFARPQKTTPFISQKKEQRKSTSTNLPPLSINDIQNIDDNAFSEDEEEDLHYVEQETTDSSSFSQSDQKQKVKQQQTNLQKSKPNLPGYEVLQKMHPLVHEIAVNLKKVYQNYEGQDDKITQLSAIISPSSQVNAPPPIINSRTENSNDLFCFDAILNIVSDRIPSTHLNRMTFSKESSQKDINKNDESNKSVNQRVSSQLFNKSAFSLNEPLSNLHTHATILLPTIQQKLLEAQILPQDTVIFDSSCQYEGSEASINEFKMESDSIKEIEQTQDNSNEQIQTSVTIINPLPISQNEQQSQEHLNSLIQQIEDLSKQHARQSNKQITNTLQEKLNQLLQLVRTNLNNEDEFDGVPTEVLLQEFQEYARRVKGQKCYGISKLKILYIYLQHQLPLLKATSSQLSLNQSSSRNPTPLREQQVNSAIKKQSSSGFQPPSNFVVDENQRIEKNQSISANLKSLRTYIQKPTPINTSSPAPSNRYPRTTTATASKQANLQIVSPGLQTMTPSNLIKVRRGQFSEASHYTSLNSSFSSVSNMHMTPQNGIKTAAQRFSIPSPASSSQTPRSSFRVAEPLSQLNQQRKPSLSTMLKTPRPNNSLEFMAKTKKQNGSNNQFTFEEFRKASQTAAKPVPQISTRDYSAVKTAAAMQTTKIQPRTPIEKGIQFFERQKLASTSSPNAKSNISQRKYSISRDSSIASSKGTLFSYE